MNLKLIQVWEAVQARPMIRETTLVEQFGWDIKEMARALDGLLYRGCISARYVSQEGTSRKTRAFLSQRCPPKD